MRSWTKLDNAAKIFPTVTNKRRTNIFSLSFFMKENVDPITLQEALEITIQRFQSFKVNLRKGLFWYYLEENKLNIKIKKENPHILEIFNKYESNGYLFRVMYYEAKISIEVFHALTDGYGAMEFLKALVYKYLDLKEIKIDPGEFILVDDENTYEKESDSFLKIYDESIKPDRSEERGKRFIGTPNDDYWLSLYTGIVSKDSFKSLLEKYDCSYTQFLVASIYYCSYKCKFLLERKNYPFQVFIPVDLRRMFPSKSLRNFSMIVKTKIFLEKDLTFDDYLKLVKEQLKEKLSEKYLLPRVIGNVKYEKMIVMRIVPLFIKQFALKIGYKKMSVLANSFCISNLGNITLPKQMEEHVEKIIFSNGAMPSSPLNMGVVYYKNSIYMTITSAIKERDFQKEFFRFLASCGLNVTLETNECEG